MYIDSQSVAGKLTSSGKTAMKGKVYRIIGVAWNHVGQHDRMSSLAPSNWPTERNSTRRRGPTMKIKVRWFDDKGPESWEKLGIVKKYLYAHPREVAFVAPQSIKYDDNIILREHEIPHKADFFIIKTAVRLEERSRH